MSVAVVVGVGASNGLGAALARAFAAAGMQVVVAGRTAQRLRQVADEIAANGGVCQPCVTDATDAGSMQALFEQAAAVGPVTAVLFNVGNNLPLAFDELTAEKFEQFWRVCTLAGFHTAKAALSHLLQNGGSLLFTGASASLRGRPGFAHFSAAKAGLRSLAQALAKEYGPQGVHVGHVVVDGAINGERLQAFLPDWLESLGEDGSLEVDSIAQAFLYLHQQPRNAWTFELDLRPFKENW